jgi:hypothetical protein
MRVAAILAIAGSFAVSACVSTEKPKVVAAQPAPIDQALAQLVTPEKEAPRPVVSTSAWEGGEGRADAAVQALPPAVAGHSPSPAAAAKIVAVVDAAGAVADEAPAMPLSEMASVAPAPPIPAVQSPPSVPSVQVPPSDPASVLAQAIAMNTVQPAAPLPEALPAAPQMPMAADQSTLASVRAGALPPAPFAERRIVTITGDNASPNISPRRQRGVPVAVRTKPASTTPKPVEDRLVNTRKVF